jgi:outer membrane biosynthesis protein TonB
MRTASAISTGLHAAVLLWALVSFSGKTFEVTPAESLPVDLINDKDFSELTKGIKDAPKAEQPKPFVEKIDELKPAAEVTPKINDKKELQAAREQTSEPQPQTKPDPIADKLKKPDEPKPEAKVEPRLPPKKPPQKQPPKFDADKIAALLDKRDPQRNAATGGELSPRPTLGAASGNANRNISSELDALRVRLMALWNPPIGARDADTQITIRIRFKRDGMLADGPQTITSGSGDRFNAMRDSAARAILAGQPYTMLRPEHYDDWKEIDFVFDTKEMFHDIPVRRPN